MEYTIVERTGEKGEDALCELQHAVRDYLALRWRPVGGVCLTFVPVDLTRFGGNDYFIAAQALTHAGAGPLPGSPGLPAKE